MPLSWHGHFHLFFKSLVLSVLNSHCIVVLLLDGLFFYLCGVCVCVCVRVCVCVCERVSVSVHASIHVEVEQQILDYVSTKGSFSKN